MNCPFHIEVYQSRLRSYRELPMRWAELGTVYRYEKSGSLHGLMRVRGFTQDDAHIICTPESIEDEIAEVLRFSLHINHAFGFTEIKPYLSTRPEKAVGEPERWEVATKSLAKAVEKCGLKCEVDEGGGAFYGPKIDLKIKDAIGREWQTTTIQFDFNLPERFDMSYIGEDGKKHRPYMVHRALLGSLERFFGILVEHYAGAQAGVPGRRGYAGGEPRREDPAGASGAHPVLAGRRRARGGGGFGRRPDAARGRTRRDDDQVSHRKNAR